MLFCQGLLADKDGTSLRSDAPKKEKETAEKVEFYVGLSRILAESKDFRGWLYVGTIFLFLSSLLQNALPALAGKMLDAVTSTGSSSWADRFGTGR